MDVGGALPPALAAGVLAVYVRTTCTGVAGGDSGELVQVAYDLGVAHPPGYPLWTLLAHVASRLPVAGSVAWRVNLSSAAFGAGAAGCLADAVATLGGCPWAGIAAGGLFAFSPHVWAYATHAEVFALHNLLLAALLALLARFAVRGSGGTRKGVGNGRAGEGPDFGRDPGGDRDKRLACWGAFVLGLALCNQHTAVFFAAPWALWALWEARVSLAHPRSFVALCGCGLLGLTPYLYLPLRGGESSAWGSWGDTSTPEGWVHHVLRRDYGTFRLANTDSATDGEYLQRLEAYVGSLPSQSLGFVGPAAAVVGAAALAGHRLPRVRGLSLALVAGLGLYLGPFFYLSNLPVSSPFFRQIQERFWPQPSLVFFCAVGVGVAQLRYVPALERGALRAALCVGLVVAQARLHWEDQDRSGHDVFTLFGRALLDNVPPAGAPGGTPAGEAVAPSTARAAQAAATLFAPDLPGGRRAMLITNGDEVINSVRYAQRCEGYRTDVVIVDLNYMQFAWHLQYHARMHAVGVVFPGANYGNRPGAFQIADFFDSNLGTWDIYSAGGIVEADKSWEHRFRLWPVGLVMRVVPRATHLELGREWQQASAKALSLPDMAKRAAVLRPAKGSWEEVVLVNHFHQAYQNRAYAVLQVALEVSSNPDIYVLAAKLYEELAAKPPPGQLVAPDYVHRNIGVCYSRVIASAPNPREAALATQRSAAAFLHYLSYSTIADADRKQIEGALMGLIVSPPAHADSRAAASTGGRAAAGAGVGGFPVPSRERENSDSHSESAGKGNAGETNPNAKPKAKRKSTTHTGPAGPAKNKRAASAQGAPKVVGSEPTGAPVGPQGSSSQSNSQEPKLRDIDGGPLGTP